MSRSLAAASQILAFMGGMVLVAALVFVFASTATASAPSPGRDVLAPVHPTGTVTWQGSHTPYPHMTRTAVPYMTGTPMTGTRTACPNMTGTPMMGTRTAMPHMTGTAMMATRTAVSRLR